MKKIDLHIHTIVTSLDSKNGFVFDIEILEKYIKDLKIDAIAITNHNVFSMTQYNDIVSKITSCTIFPGIEISLDTGHILVIAPVEKLIEFDSECSKIKHHFKTNDSISVDDFLTIFNNLKNYLVIPHYDKSPKIQESVIRRLREHIFCGEVQSPKKFEYCIKDETKLTPVLFSDFRNYDYHEDPSKKKTFPIRQTYVDCTGITLPNIKLALMDKTKVSLTPSKFSEDFQVLPDGTIASTGINVLLGQRSSGKTYTLDTIRNTYDEHNINYIKQFSLIDGTDQERFERTTASEKSDFTDAYLEELKGVVEKVSKIDLQLQKSSISEYVTSLISYAKNQDKDDAYSKIKLFSETSFPSEEINELKKLIQSVVNLIENSTYKPLIEKYLTNDLLIALFEELNDLYEKKKLANKIIDETNMIVKSIRDILGKKSAVPQPTDCDIISYARDNYIVKQFNSLIDLVKTEKEILKETAFGTFKIIGKCSRIKNVTDLKKQIKDTQISKDDYDRRSTSYELLKFLLSEGVLKSKNESYKAFWKIEYEVVNSYGKTLSGGEKAEYNLLTKLKNSQKYELILIDEPESSFDNIFLKSNVIQIIKDLSLKSTVFIVTHNNNLGVLIKPNRLLYTEKQITANGVEYKIYSGKYDDKELVATNGEKILNFEVLLNTMEAGEPAYNERKEIYETTKNR